MDSFDIAQWADKHSQVGDAAKLFPDGQLEALHKYADPAMQLLLINKGVQTPYTQ